MEFNMEYNSINRRVAFGSMIRVGLFSLFNKVTYASAFYRTLEFLAQFSYDCFESIRIGQLVPDVGRPNIYAANFKGKISQQPQQRTYYHDKRINSTVGMFLGIDIIKNGDEYYPIDFNLNAGLKTARRKLFTTEFDPILSGLEKIALKSHYDNVYCHADYWSIDFVNEFRALNKKSEVKFIPTSPYQRDIEGVTHLLNIPEQLEPNSLYVIFNYNHTPLDFFITNQSYTSLWIKEGIKKNRQINKDGFLNYFDSYNSLSEVAFKDSGIYPNLVIKLGGGWAANFVKIAKIAKGQKGIGGLDITEKELYSLFNRNIFTKLRGWVGQHQKLLFQEFIQPEINNKGCAQIIRADMLLAPVNKSMLACRRVVNDLPIPDDIPYGLVQDDRPYIVNLNTGVAHYERIESKDEQVINEVCSELCEIMHDSISKKFFVTAGNSPKKDDNHTSSSTGTIS